MSKDNVEFLSLCGDELVGYGVLDLSTVSGQDVGEIVDRTIDLWGAEASLIDE